MKKLKTKLRQYVGIFRGVPIPWVMLILVLLIFMAESQLALQQTTLNADIIDGSQQAINQEKLVRFVLLMLAGAVVSFQPD